MSTGVIYGLRDPRDGELRYVGKTQFKAQYRHQGHIANAISGASGGVCNWIRALLADELEPELIILELDPIGTLGQAERAWITYARQTGCRLVNHSEGGDGGSEPCVENCTCARHKRRKCTPGCACGRHTRSGNHTRERASGYKLSAEAKANIAVGSRKHWATHIVTDEERRNRSDAARRRWARQKGGDADVV